MALALLGTLVVVYLVCKLLIETSRLSPLRRIPNAHPTSSFSSLWINYMRWSKCENRAIHAAFRRHGSIVRLAPHEIAVNSIERGVHTVYGGGFEKHEWYSNLFDNYDVSNMFSTTASQPHSVRKRMLSNVYSKSYLHKSHALRRITSKLLHERLLPSLIHTSGSYEQHTNTLPRQVSLQRCAGLVDVLNLFSAITMDFVSAYQFGLQNGSRMTRREDEKGSTSMTVAIDRDEFFHLYRIRQAYTFWPQEHPRFTQFLHSFGIRLVPKFVDEANVRIEDMIMRMCDSAAASLKMSNGRDKEEKDRPENTPTVFKQLSESLARKDVGATKGLRSAKNASVHRRQDIASEMLDHLAAGFETSGITLSYATYELSKHPEIQAKLREELRSLHGLQYSSATSQEPTLDTSSPSTTELPPIPDAKDLDSLTLLHAIILETLRLHAAIPGPQPRVTPYRTFKNLAKTISTIGRKSNDAQATGAAAKTSNSLVGHHEIPGGIRVSAQAYSLHRNQDIFPEPEEWRPNRWLLSTEEGKNFNSNNGVERSGIGDPCDTDVERFKEMHRWFWAFGSGGRMCVGNNLAVYQMKYILATIYSNFETFLPDKSDEMLAEQMDRYTAPPKKEKLMLRFEMVS